MTLSDEDIVTTRVGAAMPANRTGDADQTDSIGGGDADQTDSVGGGDADQTDSDADQADPGGT